MKEEEVSSTVALAAGALLPAVATVFFNGIPGSRGGSALPRWGVRLPILLTCAAQLWFTLVSRAVPEPYLDEIFHIPQAQKYCEGRFTEWDDKITTPPGLYLFSVAVHRIATALRIPHLNVCDPSSLRAINCLGVVGVSYLALWCRQALEARQHEAATSSSSSSSASPIIKVRAFSQYAVHTAVNIGLFPLLFFFAGLYYTDVLSTAAVLAAFANHLSRVGADTGSLLSDVTAVLLGVVALLMRQTNVFWVVVFMGGLEAVHAVKTLRPERVDQPEMRTLGEQGRFFAWRYAVGDVHDLPVHEAYPDDMLFTTLSIGIAALCNPIHVLRQIWPYIVVLMAFAGFVQWNGGVVLGDKSNHVATIHLAQMLYIWPFFAFFSLPLVLPSGLSFLNMLTSAFAEPASAPPPTSSFEPKPPASPAQAPAPPGRLLGAAIALFRSKIIWPAYLAATFVLSVAVAKLNTIIHPFTLADNRHYMFYVFRYTIRRGNLVRLALVLPYTLCRWMVWDALGGHGSWSTPGGAKQTQPTAYVSYPLWAPAPSGVKRQTTTPYPRAPETSSAAAPENRRACEAALKSELEQDSLFLSTRSVPTSSGLIFLLATSLSLITAPLVEPRYFIIPWVVWRLMVPAWRLQDHIQGGFLAGNAAAQAVADWSRGYDMRLFLEGAWHIAINVVTGYIFLSKPYVWKAEDGTVLENGSLQRFMW